MSALEVPGSPGADFGPLIATRRRPWLDRIVLSFIVLIFWAIIVVGFIAAGQSIGKVPGPSLLGMGACVALGYGCYRFTREIFRVTDFHERGAVSRGFGRRREFAYERAVSLWYRVTRHYVHGLYGGTQIAMRLDLEDGRKLRLDLRHKERPKGLAITILGKTFEGEDEMDVVRDVIASNIAARMTARLSAGEEVKWAGGRLTADGLVPSHGARKNQLVGWAQIRGFASKDGFMFLFVDGDQRASVAVACGGPNVFPALQIVASMMGVVAEEARAA